MKQYSYEDCVSEGLLRSIPPSREKAEGSIRAAERWLEEARKDLDNETFNSSVISSYLAMFHSARSILFFDGIREKSHFCIARYLEEKYVKNGLLESKWVEILDHYRQLRHDDQYTINFFTSKEEAEKMLEASKLFVDRMRALLESIKG